MRFTIGVMVGVLGLVSPKIASAGPWAQAKGTSYQQTSVNYVTVMDREEYALNYYAEVGIGRDWTFVGAIPIRFSSPSADRPSGQPGQNFFSLSPVAGLRWTFLTRPLVLAYQVDLGFPIVEGSVDFTNQLLLGGALFSGKMFYQAAGGIRLRTQSAGHEAIWSGDIGVWLGSPILAIAAVRGRYQTEPTIQAQLREEEHRVGSQWIYRLRSQLDLGVEVLYTFRNSSVSEGVSTTAYLAFRR